MEELCSTQLLALLRSVGLGLGLAGAHLELLHPHCIQVVCKKHTTKLWPCSQPESLGSAATWLQKENLGGNPLFTRMKEIYFELFYSG